MTDAELGSFEKDLAANRKRHQKILGKNASKKTPSAAVVLKAETTPDPTLSNSTELCVDNEVVGECVIDAKIMNLNVDPLS